MLKQLKCRSVFLIDHFSRTHLYRRRLVLHQARGVRGPDRPGKPDHLRVEVKPPQFEVVPFGTAVLPTEIGYLKSNQAHFWVRISWSDLAIFLASGLLSTRRIQIMHLKRLSVLSTL